MAFKVNLPTLIVGVAYNKSFRWYTQTESGIKVPVNLDNMSGMIQLRKEKPEDPVLAVWSTSNGFLKFSDTNKISIELPRTEVLGYTFTAAVWDLIAWPLGLKEQSNRVMYGEVETEHTVTDIT